jgi:outer membrane protein OmpA-like peptidoglycan-associated protein
VRRRAFCLVVLAAISGACGSRQESQPSTAPASGSASETTTPTAPAESGEEGNPLDALLGGLDPEEHPLEPWPLEAAPADWRAHSTTIPLVAGLTTVVAVQEPRGDYESMAQVEAVEPERTVMLFSLRSGEVAGVKSSRARRIVSTHDMAEAHGYRMVFSPTDPETFPGMTALGVSSAVYRDLEGPGKSHLDLYAGADLVGTMLAVGDALPSDLTGELERASADPVGIAVLVNGRRMWLPALHAKGDFQGVVRKVPAEFWMLANAKNPITLRAQVDRARLQLVRIDFPVPETTAALEEALAERRAVEMWGVYFEFGSAELQPESAAVLEEVAGVLRRHPDWRLRVEGHTDNVGDDGDNLKLSQQRADAVRAELLRRLGSAGTQISAAGFGEARPRESNDTLSGRARNRRVELLRE